MTQNPQHQQPQHQPDRTDIERTQRLLGPRYQLSWIIGRGGMSTVWLARDTQQQRDVAVKILKPEYTENQEFRERFRNEAEAAERFDSPNVVATYDYGEVGEARPGAVFCYIVMEYVRGESLADVLRREKQLPETLVVDLIRQTATGLAAIHATGTVHRDIKPGNLLLTAEGTVKVTDFGISKAAEAVPLTQTGMVVGTAQYVSPEQAQGQVVTSASDIYSLGVVAYETLTGRRPFRGDSSVSVAIKHISEQPAPLPDTVSQPVRDLVAICLRKNPRSRYADGQELAAAAATVAAGGPAPQPAAVPEAGNSHAHTEIFTATGANPAVPLSQVVTGPGTAVPPHQGPAQPPRTGTHRAQPQPVGQQGWGKRSGKKSATPWIVLGTVLALGAGLGAWLMLSDSGSDAPSPKETTTTVTSEVTTSPTEEYTAPEEPEYVPQPQRRPETEEPTSERPSSQSNRTSRPERPTQQAPEPTRQPAPNQTPTSESPGNTGTSPTNPEEQSESPGADNNAGGAPGLDLDFELPDLW